MPSSQQGFFARQIFGVSGASADPAKFGNIILKRYISKSYKVVPINPRGGRIEDLDCVASVQDLVQLAKTEFSLDPEDIGLSIVTPPSISEKTIEIAIRSGIKYIWLQPGSEPSSFQETAKKHNITIIGGGPCVLVSSAM